MTNDTLDDTPLNLQELLDSIGINKSALAKLMKVSRSTIMRLGDHVTDEALAAIDKYKADMTHDQSEAVPVPIDSSCVVNPEILDEVDYLMDILLVTHKNIAHSRTWHHLDRKQVADKFDMSVFVYNQAVHNTIAYCYDNDTNFKQLRV